MTPEAVLRLVVRRLPERRREWGPAMEAELAGLDSGRWRFALSCARGVLGRPETIVILVPSLLVAGAAGIAVWLLAAIDPGVPTSTGPALLAIAFAAICARGRIAGLCAAATAALLIAVLIDGPLQLLAPWVANSAPPVYPPESVDRLVDSVGIWLLGTLIGAALGLTTRANRHANVTSPA